MPDHENTPESRDHDDSRGASPGADSDSTGVNTAPKFGAVKDRACPFCHQLFTSSSLGRHLDTYIRSKNPKAPDGVHDVAEIRKIRGGITRRHARNSSTAEPGSKRAASSETQLRPLPNGAAPLQPVQPAVQPQPPMHPSYMSDKARQVFRTNADWTATGVINNLPPRGPSTPNSRDLPLPRPDYQPEQRQFLDDNNEERDNARAVELALKEVLTNVQDAVARARKPPVFDFDPLTFNFPALCLRVLQVPTTLFSATPAPNEGSWPLALPTSSSYETLRSVIIDRVKLHQQRDVTGREGTSAQDDDRGSRQEPPKELQSFVDHLDSTYSHWMQLSEARKQEVWDLELMRAFADEARQNKVLDEQLDDAYREVIHLRAQIEAINRQQPWQRSRSPHASSYPNPTPAILPKKVAREMADADVDLREWDFDRLVNKWKHSVRPRPSWAWTNAPPPPSGAPPASDVRTASNPGAYSRSYGPSADAMQSSSQSSVPAPPYGARTAMDPAPAVGSSIDAPIATSPPETQDPAGHSDVEMKDQGPTQFRRSRRMFAREGTG